MSTARADTTLHAVHEEQQAVPGARCSSEHQGMARMCAYQAAGSKILVSAGSGCGACICRGAHSSQRARSASKYSALAGWIPPCEKGDGVFKKKEKAPRQDEFTPESQEV